MQCNNIIYLVERNGGSGGSDTLLNGPDEALNFRDMFLLYEKFRFIPIAVIYLRSGSNLLSACISVIVNPRCRYNLYICIIPSVMFLNFRFLIILPVANMT